VALTIGKFDGVHLGHRRLAQRLVALAAELGALPLAVLLHPDPATVLAGAHVPLLATLPERSRRLAALGVAKAWHLPFDRELAGRSPAAFWRLLADQVEVAGVVVGPDFRFGQDRSGDLATLAELAGRDGFRLDVVPPVLLDGERVGSRAVRNHILSGDVAHAARLLGAPPRLVGTVVDGARRGRGLGFPTANLALLADFAVPANGIYVVHAGWRRPGDQDGAGGGAYGLASVGVRPTFDHGERIVEVYLLDFAGDLYGAQMTVDFLARQRGEERFESAEALVEQMHRDEAEARAWLAERYGVSDSPSGVHPRRGGASLPGP
jgi:riboflavin kinase/FMN adenylyltransferase